DLVAAGPDRGQRLRRPQLAAPADLALPAALPADLLARRPDVAAARAQVQAAAHGVAAAEADFYPNVNLTAFAGLQSIGLSQLLQAQGLRAQLRSRRLSFSVDLVRALGGGYSARSSPT